MYHPTGRVLTVLELLQSRPQMSGPELAARLEMDVRSVRRYVTILQDVGIPVESAPGRAGGYRLRPGFKLPPLMFTDEEATAVGLGLLATSWLELDQPAQAVEGALAKLLRVLPLRVRSQLQALAANLSVSPQERAAPPDASLLLELSAAIQQRQAVALAYETHERQTRREVEPYALGGWWGRWYLVGFCRLRRDYRVFRLDRIETARTLDDSFERDAAFDAQSYLRDHLGLAARWEIRVEFEAPPARIRELIPASYGELSEAPGGGTLFESRHGDLASTARYLSGLSLPFIVHGPPELRELVRAQGELLLRAAGGPALPLN
ncbi:MAG TPA: YafY family protein [Herpetosiphonaceae bacterium]